MATIQEIQALADSLPDLSGVTFPSAKDVVKDRMRKQEGITEKSLDNITDSSPAVLAADMEIAQTKSQLNVLISQLPLLAVPITIPLALATVKALLPSTLKLLSNLDIPIPSALTPLIEAIDLAQSIIDTAADALSVPPLNILGDILGIKHS